METSLTPWILKKEHIGRNGFGSQELEPKVENLGGSPLALIKGLIKDSTGLTKWDGNRLNKGWIIGEQWTWGNPIA